MGEREFAEKLVKGLSQISAGIGTIMAALVARYCLGRPERATSITPTPTFGG